MIYYETPNREFPDLEDLLRPTNVVVHTQEGTTPELQRVGETVRPQPTGRRPTQEPSPLPPSRRLTARVRCTSSSG